MDRRAGQDITPDSLHVFETSGGPDRTRICDLYRVKVVRSIAYEGLHMKTKELRVDDLDLKWTSEPFWTSRGPHTCIL